jgi:two-component system chemotaxis response regulator CheY
VTLQSTNESTDIRSGRQRVLVVDDSPSFRRILRHVLDQGGFEVLEAADAAQALATLERTSVALVLSDQNLPGTDGLGLTREVRTTSRHASVPIVIVTTESSDAMKLAGRAAGATAWVVKPFDPDRLLGLVRELAPPPGAGR